MLRKVVLLLSITLVVLPSGLHAESSLVCRDFEQYGKLLDAYVQDGRVNYARLHQAEGQKQLELAVEDLKKCTSSKLQQIEAGDRIAYWINAYNILTLKVVMDHYPIESSWFRGLRYPDNSIRQINGAWTDFKFAVGGRSVSLDDIEHSILRRKYQEPRIHFAVNCASKGCPALRPEPYVGERLEAQLEDQVQVFLNDPVHGFRIDHEAETVYLSSILDWFGKDFFAAESRAKDRLGQGNVSMTESAVLRFLAERLEGKDRDYLLTAAYDINYLDYDWSLNE